MTSRDLNLENLSVIFFKIITSVYLMDNIMKSHYGKFKIWYLNQYTLKFKYIILSNLKNGIFSRATHIIFLLLLSPNYEISNYVLFNLEGQTVQVCS